MRFSLFIFIILFSASSAFSESMQIRANGIEVFCKFLGEGDPIVCLHGGPAIPDDLITPYISPLKKNNHVIFYFQRGSGDSLERVNENTANWDVFVKDLEALRDALNLKKMILLGHCWGCSLAIRYALAYPEFVDKLILLAPAPVTSSSYKSIFKGHLKNMQPYQKEKQLIVKSQEFINGEPRIVKRYCELVHMPYFYDPELTKQIDFSTDIQLLNRTREDYKFFHNNQFLTPFNWCDQLKLITFPTLIIHGDFDYISIEPANDIHQNIPGSQCILLEKCGHFPMIEKNEEVLHHIKKFLAKIS